jgi:hypothetical protein
MEALKNILILGIFISISFNCYSQDTISGISQQQKIRKNIIKFSPTAVIETPYTFLFSYERWVRKNNSIQINLGVIPFGMDLQNEFGGTVELQYRSYLWPRKKCMGGLYLSPFLKYRYIEYNYAGFYNQINSIGGGLVAGYQFIIAKKFSIDYSMHMGMKYSNWNKPYKHESFNLISTDDLTFGILF